MIKIQSTKKKYSLAYEIVIIILAVTAVTITILDLTSVITLSPGSFLYWLDFLILIIFIVFQSVYGGVLLPQQLSDMEV